MLTNHDTAKEVWSVTFDSLDDLADHCAKREDGMSAMIRKYGQKWSGGARDGAAVLKLAREGWAKHSDEALDVATAIVTDMEADQTIPAFVPTFDVTGCEVEMGRYLSGEPECMVDYPLTEIVKAGRVITLCASVSMSASIKPETIVRRGQAVAALAIALSRFGYGVEIWADFTAEADMGAGRQIVAVRTRVKSATEVLDPERVLFALAHPNYLRTLMFGGVYPDAPKAYQRFNTGYPLPPVKNLPEGTIYLAGVRSEHDVPEAPEFVRAHLRELGILAD